MEHQPLTDWFVYQSKIKDMKAKEMELFACSDSKCVKIAEQIARNKKDCLPYEHLEKELTLEMEIMKLRTRIFVGRNLSRLN